MTLPTSLRHHPRIAPQSDTPASDGSCTPAAVGQPLGRTLGRAVAVVIGLLAPLLLLELSLRLFGPWLPGGYDTGMYIIRDEALEHAHAPNYDGWMRGPEFTTHVRISPLGLLPPMRQATLSGHGPLYYAVDGHWNADGHLFAAQAVAASLIERGLAGR